MSSYIVMNNYGLDFLYPLSDETEPVFAFETKSYQFKTNGDALFALGNKKLTVTNINGNVEYVLLCPFKNPVLKLNKGYSLVYDEGGKGLSLYRGADTLIEMSLSDEIIFANINKNGYVTVASKAKGYKGQLGVYNLHGELIYQWMISEHYIVEADLSGDNKLLAVSLLSYNNEARANKLFFVDVTTAEILAECTTSELVVDAQWSSDSTVRAVSENAIACYNAQGECLWSTDFMGASLHAYAFAENGHFALSLSGSRNNSVISVYDAKGELSGQYESTNEIRELSVYKNLLAFIEDTNVIKLDFKAQEILAKEKPAGALRLLAARKGVLVLDNKAAYYIKD